MWIYARYPSIRKRRFRTHWATTTLGKELQAFFLKVMRIHFTEKQLVFMRFATLLSILIPLTHFSIYNFAVAVVHLLSKTKLEAIYHCYNKKFKVLVLMLKDAHRTAFLMNAFFLLHKHGQLLRAVDQDFQRTESSSIPWLSESHSKPWEKMEWELLLPANSSRTRRYST